MLDDRRLYMNLVIKVATLLSINLTPSLDRVVERFGGERYKEKIKQIEEEYKVHLRELIDW